MLSLLLSFKFYFIWCVRYLCQQKYFLGVMFDGMAGEVAKRLAALRVVNNRIEHIFEWATGV